MQADPQPRAQVGVRAQAHETPEKEAVDGHSGTAGHLLLWGGLAVWAGTRRVRHRTHIVIHALKQK